MEYFLDIVDTVPKGVGFSLYDSIHLTWLAVFAVLTLVCCFHYRRLSENARGKWRKIAAALLIADEIFKQTVLILTGNWLPEYLPLHLCSINIFVICYHAFKPGHLSGNFLYTVCIPGALAALLFPSWTELPLLNFMHLHSFTVHILLAMYPIVLTAAGDIKVDAKTLPKCLLSLLAMAIAAYLINPVLNANFFFMANAGKGNPLYWFEVNWGGHLYGFPVLLAAIVTVMHLPWLIARRLSRSKSA